MAKISSQEAVAKIGNRFDLVLVAATRARELENGSPSKLPDQDNNSVISALREIELGLYTKQDYLKKLHKRESK